MIRIKPSQAKKQKKKFKKNETLSQKKRHGRDGGGKTEVVMTSATCAIIHY